ncbi:MAG: hypothetical protein KDA91_20170, partial [Planctomycetaceae bacterium]|nr:hypothetical protein [Planctomycetaceae bacterium]
VFLPDSIITMRLRFFVVGKFFYGIAVIGGPAQVENREAEKFVNSFESLDLKAPSKKKRKRSVNGGSSGPIDAKGLQYLQSKIGGFEMYTIAQPKLIQQSNTLPCGDELQMNFFVMGARPSLLLVVHADLQDGMFESERELVETLRSAADTVGREMGGTVRSFQRLPDQNDQAEWSVAIDANEGGSNIRGRMIIRGTRFYQVYAVGSESFVQSRTAVTALDSFDLL